MVIKPVSASNMYYQKQKPEKTGFGGKDNQKITLQADSQLNLGTINGKAFDMKINAEGGYQWSGAIPIKLTNSSKVTQEDAAAAYAAHSYSREEYNECAQVSGVINYLYLITDRGWAADQFNSFCDTTKKTQKNVESALSRLGLNKDKPFNINGRMFIYDAGILKDYAGE